MASTSLGKASRFFRANPRACSPAPTCQPSAPQQVWPRGITTSTPLRTSTAIVSSLIWGSITCWAHPTSKATRALGVPIGFATSGSLMPLGNVFGSKANIERTRSGKSRPNGLASMPTLAAIRNLPGQGKMVSKAFRLSFSATLRLISVSAFSRKGPSRLRYSTPEGQDVSQAKQPRQRSMCGSTCSVDNFPSNASFIRMMRPRGESISWPSSE